jgi:hypothetical protein
MIDAVVLAIRERIGVGAYGLGGDVSKGIVGRKCLQLNFFEVFGAD